MKLIAAFAVMLALAGCAGGCTALDAASHVAKAAHACENTRKGLQQVIDFTAPDTKAHRVAVAELDALHVLCDDDEDSTDSPED